MKNLTIASLALVAIVGATVLTTTSASAIGEGGMREFNGEGRPELSPAGHRGSRGGMMRSGGLIPEEMKEEFRSDFENMTEEEKVAMKEQRQSMREERQASMQEFTGVTREEFMQAKEEGKTMGDVLTEQGKTQADAESFLTKQANNRIDNMVEKHDLTTIQEQTLRNRVIEFVQNILTRWYPVQ